MIDDLFYLIINKSEKISKEFLGYLEKLDLLYSKEIIETTELKNSQMLKEIIYTLYEIFNSRFKYLVEKFQRDNLIKIYNYCKDEERNKEIQNFIAYYKKSLINKYTENLN